MRSTPKLIEGGNLKQQLLKKARSRKLILDFFVPSIFNPRNPRKLFFCDALKQIIVSVVNFTSVSSHLSRDINTQGGKNSKFPFGVKIQTLH